MPDENAALLAALPLDQVLSTIPSGLFLVDRQQRIVYWNREAERITGYSAAEAVGRHCSFLAGIPCGSGCGLFEKDLPKPVIGATCTVQTADGRRITLLKNIDYLRDATGAVVGGVESFIDLSHQAALEEELRRQAADLEETVHRRTAELEAERTQLRTLLDAMADLAYICSSDRRIVFMNRAMVAAFGDRTGQTCHEVFYGSSTPCEPCPLQRILAGETCRQEQTLSPPGASTTFSILPCGLRTARC